MRIAVLLISTGNYNKFIPDIVSSIKDKLNPDDSKEIFLFSDKRVDGCINYKIKHKKWPFVTLERFHTFIQAYDRLRQYDFILYMDVDLEVVTKISLPFEDIQLLGVKHPGAFRINDLWPVEDNPLSTAYLPPEPWIYHQGCLWGANKELFFDMNHTLANNIDKDLANHYVAKWHDESHLNRYLYDHKDSVTTLTSSFAYPEHWNLLIEKMIIHKDKNMQEYPRFEGVK